MGSEKRVRLGHRGVSFILSIFEVHLEVIGTKVGGHCGSEVNFRCS